MKTELDSAWESAIHNAERARKAEAEVERLRAERAELLAAIEAMRVAGGAAEFQRAFDEAKIIAARKGEGE